MPSFTLLIPFNQTRVRTSITTMVVTGISSQDDDTTLWAAKNAVVRTRSSVRTPGWKALTPRNKVHSNLPVNPYSYEEAVIKGGWATVNTPLVNYGFSTRRAIIRYGPAIVAGVSNADYTMVNSVVHPRLIQKMKGQEWNAPIFFAEAGKTVRMVVKRATTLVNLLNSLRRGNFPAFFRELNLTSVGFPKDPGFQTQRLKYLEKIRNREKALTRKFNLNYGKDAQKAIANAWLEHRYGWMPFQKDVYDAVMTLMDISDRPLGSQMIGRVHASVTQKYQTQTPDQVIFSDPEESFSVKGQYIEEVMESVRGTWRFRSRPQDVIARLGLYNPLEVAWEVIPFSFVGDWFLPIGDYLKALDVDFRCDFVDGSYGHRVYSKLTTLESSFVPPSYSGGGFNGHGTRVKVKREKMFGNPSISFADLVFAPKISAVRATSAIALLVQGLKGLSESSRSIRF